MAEDKAKVKELEAKIATLKELGEDEAVARYEAQLAALKGGVPVAEEKGEGLVFTLPVNEEEWEKASSKFAAVGAHRSEFGMPYWKDKGKTIAIPFTITAEGPDNGKEGEYFVGIDAKAVWKLKEIVQEAAGVPITFVKGKDGQKHPQFEAAAVAGKEFESVWTEQVDSRSAAEGGKGTKYTKPTSALPLGSTPESLGI